MLAITTEQSINTVFQHTLRDHNTEAVSNGSLHSQKVDIIIYKYYMSLHFCIKRLVGKAVMQKSDSPEGLRVTLS